MGRAPCCTKVGLHRGPWTAREDALLIKYIQDHGEGQWRSLPKKAGLLRCGKSCRLRWMNYLRPDIKRGNITPEEDDLIIRLHALLGNRWSLIAGRLPGRTDNEIKNYWNTHLSKRLRIIQGTDPPNTVRKVSEGKRSNTKCNTVRRHKNLMNNKTKTTEDNNSSVGDETEKTKIHLPKPIRVTSMVSLTSNDSNRSFETNMSNTTTTTTTTSASSSSHSQVEKLNHGGIFDSENINANNNIMDIVNIPWLTNNADMVEENGFDYMMKMGLCGDYVNHDMFEPNGYHHPANFGAQDENKQFEKLYEEYLQLIKVDHTHAGGFVEDADDEIQLDSFSESFLI